MKKYLFFILILFFGCNLDSPNISVSNKTQIFYDSIYVYTNSDEPNVLYNLGPSQTINKRIHFDQNNSADGAYRIQLINADEILRERIFGYYTNGASIDRGFNVFIEADTIIVDPK